MRNQTIDETEDRCFSTAGCPAEQDSFAFLNVQRKIMQSRIGGTFVLKIDILNLDHTFT
jgi:hypothetical protein